MANDKKWKADNKPSTREWQERMRAKIASSKVLDTAIQCAAGKLDITSTRATMVKALLDRVLPVQTENTEHQGEPQKPDLASIREAIANSPELQAVLASLIAPKPVQTVESTPQVKH